MKTILALVDFSPITGRVVDTAVTLARPAGASLWLVHIADPEPEFIGYDAGPDVVRDAVARERRAEHRDVQALADLAASQGVDATALMVQGPLIEKALEEAERLEADLIVCGSHGRGALYNLVVGTVADGLIRGARVPVVVVPAARPN